MDIFIYVFAAVVVATLLWFVTRKNVKEKQEDAQPSQAAQSQSEGQPKSRRRFGSRVQRGIERARQPPRVEEKEEDDESGSDTEVKKVKKIGAKKQKKLLMKEERRLQREADEKQREEQKLEQEKIDQMRMKEEEKEQLEEERKEAEAKRLKEEKEKRELEEYLKMKEAFEIEEEGLERDLEEEEESQHLLEEFINYIKECKVVFLEDLASHFGLRTQDAIDRVQDLLKDGLLTGVIDDRGKFIYISMEELKAVADFVEQRGRVSISDLARVSNSLINITPERELTLSN